jgi:glycosyltransferase involved in cell wall biosynthesis
MQKRRIMIMTDSPRIRTGFSNIGRHVADILHRSGQWDVHYVAWFDNPTLNPDIEIPYRLYNTAKDQQGRLIREDQYAYHSFKQLHDQIKPDIVWICGDEWMQAFAMWHYPDKATRPAPYISYVPIDSSPCPYETIHQGGPQGEFTLNWPDHFRRFDEVIAYGQWGMDEINKRCKDQVVRRFIHHGADCSIFKPLSKEEKLRIRREKYGIPDDAFVVATVARNQPRKCYPDMLRAIKYFIEHHEQPGRKIIYVPICPLRDVGWNLETFMSDIGLTYRDIKDRDMDAAGNLMVGPHRVLIDRSLQVGGGLNEVELNELYNAADVGLFIYTSEGWALPPHEHGCGDTDSND